MLNTVEHLIQTAARPGRGYNQRPAGSDADRGRSSVGEKLDDANIIAQCITFLIAAHETTSGLLSFALYALLRIPACWREPTTRWTACWART